MGTNRNKTSDHWLVVPVGDVPNGTLSEELRYLGPDREERLARCFNGHATESLNGYRLERFEELAPIISTFKRSGRVRYFRFPVGGTCYVEWSPPGHRARKRPPAKVVNFVPRPSHPRQRKRKKAAR
jgi:hypothetical protein